MSGRSDGSDLFDTLVDEYLERYRRGERPSLSAFAEEHPEHAERIRSLIPAVLAMEECGPSSEVEPRALRPASLAETPQRLGDYLLIRPLGAGGMGVVYEAVQESLGRHVALKTVPTGPADDATRLERFRREALAAARLHHAHIVPVYGIGEHDGLHFYTMQFVHGCGLDLILREVDRLRRTPVDDGTISEATDAKDLSNNLAWGLCHGHFLPDSGLGAAPAREPQSQTSTTRVIRPRPPHQTGSRYPYSVAWLGAQVAEALEYAHRQGVLHRDIKPSNLLLDAQGHIWVTDFGLAKTHDGDELTRTGDIVGTLRYMAPERFGGWSDPRSDIFALGATLYELLTLRPAFDEPDRIKLVDRLLHGNPPSLRQHDRGLPRDLETVVLKSLAKTPGERYATAGQLADDLRRIVAGRPILASRSSVIKKAWRWSRRNPAGAGAVVTVVAALTATAVVSMLYAQQQRSAVKKIKALAADLANERKSLRASLAESHRILAMNEFDRGRAALRDDEFGPGLLWMMAAWRSAIDANDPAWRHLALANLSAWCAHVPRLKALLSHEAPVESAAFSPDGKTVLTGGDDFTARLWDTDSAAPRGDPIRHPDKVCSVAFSPDGKTVLTGCSDGMARFWDAVTMKPVGVPLRHAEQITTIAFSPNGKTVLTGSSDDTARLWDAATGRPIGQPLAAALSIMAAVFRPGSHMVATASRDRHVRLWDAFDGKPIGQPLTHDTEVLALAFSPDGKTLLAGCWSGTSRAWDIATGRPVGSARKLHRGHIRGVAYSPDGKTYATGSEDKSARLWDATTHEPLGPPLTHQGPVVAVAFSADGKWLLTASSDHTVRVWDTASCRYPAPALEVPLGGEAVAFHPDGKSFFGAYYGGIVLRRDVSTGRPLGRVIRFRGVVQSLATSRDGKSLLVGGAPARIWDLASGEPIGHALSHPGGAQIVAFSPDGTTVATGGGDRTHRLWNAVTGEPIGEPISNPGAVDALAFSPDGRTLYAGLDTGTAKAWDVKTGKPVGHALRHPGAVSVVAFSPDGKTIVTGSEDGMARVWDAETGRLRVPPLPHRAWVFAAAFSPDGSQIVTGSRDETAQLWDTATGQPIGPPRLHPGHHVWAVAVAPNGKSILTGDTAYSARIFAIAPMLPDDPKQIARRVEVLTGLRLDTNRGFVETLNNATWRATRDELMRSESR